MSRAKVKVTVRKGRGGNGASLIARVPVKVEKNDHPTGQLMYQTKAQASIRIKTTHGGKPRVSR